ncbi:hypothetical protein [uncultured Bacteroides sp.]|jgi:hypothetical protein|uniref:hypothetical protein n=1 Tax=uncultured Bacteroides sp. TaxID=162156 RepID=UPI00280A689F|nr:hypothetical protein [uncultured Bacteroides sp.]
MKKIDFRKVKIQLTFEGHPVEMDIRKAFGNIIHQNTADLGVDELARKIYFSDGEVEIPEEYISILLDISSRNMNVPAQNAIRELLEK